MEPSPCATCGQLTCKRCAGCQGVNYCSHACQKQGWTRHKKDCQRPREMATSEVCKALIETMRSPEVAGEPKGNVLIDPRQLKVALLCGVPRHRLGALFVQRSHQWINELKGESFCAALAASGYATRPCSEEYFRSVMRTPGSGELMDLIQAGPAAVAKAGGVVKPTTQPAVPDSAEGRAGRPCTPARAKEVHGANVDELAAMTGKGQSEVADVFAAPLERDGRASAEGLSEAEAFGRFAQDMARSLGMEHMLPPAKLEAYKREKGMSTTERSLPQSAPHVQAMIDAANQR